jgi:pilus assembly protein CpaB
MDRKRLLFFLVISLFLALVASIGAYRFMSEKSQAAEQAKLQTAGVVVAAIPLPVGSTINPNQLSVTPWPKENLPKDGFSDPNALAGRVAMRDFVAGEPVVESKLVPTQKTAGLLSLKVPSGMRAFSVKVNEVVGVGGFIIPDARVDVLVTTAVSAQRQQEQVSKTVLEDVLVLAAGQATEVKDNKPVTVNTVTLAVTPEDAERLALASNDGHIQLVLRNFADNASVTTQGVDKGRLLSSLRHAAPPPVVDAAPKAKARPRAKARAEAPPPAPAPAAAYVPPPPAPRPAPPPPPEARKKRVVEVIKGVKKSEESFED